MIQIFAAGNIGKDAETRDVGQETVTSFSLATESGWGDRKATIWLDCSVWGKRGSALRQHLTKGTQVAVTGELSTREHNGKTYLSLRVAELKLMGGRQQQERQEQRPASRQEPADEIPF